MHIALGIDSNYVHPALVTIMSVAEHNPSSALSFHIFGTELSTDDLNKIRQVENTIQQSIQVHDAKAIVNMSSVAKHSRSPKHISAATFTRLIIPESLQKTTDRVLYLDADVLCTGDISGLSELPMSLCAAAVKDRFINKDKKHLHPAEQFHCMDFYFNAGILLINIGEWIRNEISEHCLEFISNPELDLPYFDQDALNLALTDKVQPLPLAFNIQYGLGRALRRAEATLSIPRDTKLIHFIGPIKPWRRWIPHEAKQLFLHYHEQSPWAGQPLEDFQNPREKKLYAYFMYKRSMKKLSPLEAWKWHSKYKKLVNS